MSSRGLFRTIVLGGISMLACGARTDLGTPVDASKPADAGHDATSFPEETAFTIGDAGAPDVQFPKEF